MKDNFVKPKKVFGVKIKNTQKMLESQSGGAFTALAEYFLSKGAVIYGCGLDENLEAVYMRIDRQSELRKLKGSKYVQASLKGTFKMMLDDLNQGRVVLFSGTPCYVSAARKCSEKNPNKNNLYTVDLICHGVPSPKVYSEYINTMEKKKKLKIIQFVFRDNCAKPE